MGNLWKHLKIYNTLDKCMGNYGQTLEKIIIHWANVWEIMDKHLKRL